MNYVRWLFLPFTCLLMWVIALVFGTGLITLAEALCPQDQIVSGICMAQWYAMAENSIIHSSVALSAVLVVGAAFIVAPSKKMIASAIVCAIGSSIAIWFAAMGELWTEAFSAITSAVIFLCVISRIHKRSLSNQTQRANG